MTIKVTRRGPSGDATILYQHWINVNTLVVILDPSWARCYHWVKGTWNLSVSCLRNAYATVISKRLLIKRSRPHYHLHYW